MWCGLLDQTMQKTTERDIREGYSTKRTPFGGAECIFDHLLDFMCAFYAIRFELESEFQHVALANIILDAAACKHGMSEV